MNRNIKGPKQQVKLRKRVEKLLHENTTAIRKIPPTDMRNLFEELQIYQVELENINNELRKAQEELQESERHMTDIITNYDSAISVGDASSLSESSVRDLTPFFGDRDFLHVGPKSPEPEPDPLSPVVR